MPGKVYSLATKNADIAIDAKDNQWRFVTRPGVVTVITAIYLTYAAFIPIRVIIRVDGVEMWSNYITYFDESNPVGLKIAEGSEVTISWDANGYGTWPKAMVVMMRED
jgi:hypothetical protein